MLINKTLRCLLSNSFGDLCQISAAYAQAMGIKLYIVIGGTMKFYGLYKFVVQLTASTF